MPIYRFRILDKFNRFIAGQYSRCADDDAAREHAESLATQAKGPGIEIWCDAQQVPRSSRPDASDYRVALPLIPDGGTSVVARIQHFGEPDVDTWRAGEIR